MIRNAFQTVAKMLNFQSCLRFFAVITSICFLWMPAEAASCNCALASSCTESVICSSPQLSVLDSKMSGLYSALQSMASRKGAKTLLSSQRNWLNSRDDCGCNANCLVSEYESRIQLFKQVIEY
jgi:uncharacterized protein